MIEDLEGLASASKDALKSERLSETALEYLGECVSPPRPAELIERIDEVQGGNPPKAIDSNHEIAELIEPIKDQIPSEYLEAPSDIEQVAQISDTMVELEDLRIENWKKLTIEERVELLNQLEERIAEIEHRPACPIEIENLGKITVIDGALQGHMGKHMSGGLFSYERIVINTELIKGNDSAFLNEVLDTIVHEGRHSYQTYNMHKREIHTSQEDITNWRWNEHVGYQDAQHCGFKNYWMQPLECDAREFAEDVLTEYMKKL